MLSTCQALYLVLSLVRTLTQAFDECPISGVYDAGETRNKLNSCSKVSFSDLQVPAGEQLDLSDLPEGITVTFSGKIVFECKEQEKQPLVLISGQRVKVIGLDGNLFDGNGACYWDKGGINGGKEMPKFFMIRLIDSQVQNLNVLNAPVHVFMISNSHGTTFSSLNVDNRDGAGLASNTDGVHVTESTDLVIKGCHIINQDDCFAMTSGRNVTFSNGICDGGHGLSIGSIGGKPSNDVSDVTLTGVTITNSMNGFRIKTIQGATGSVSNIKVSDLTLQNIAMFGIVIRQDYTNSGASTPKMPPSNGVTIENLVISNVRGSVEPQEQPIFIYCGTGSCHNWSWSDINIEGGTTKKFECLNLPDGSSGVFC